MFLKNRLAFSIVARMQRLNKVNIGVANGSSSSDTRGVDQPSMDKQSHVHLKYGIVFFIHSKTWTAAPLKFVNG